MACFSAAYANHIMGGYMQYTYLGPGAGNTSNYRVALDLYINCATGEGSPPSKEVVLSVFDGTTNDNVLVRTI